MARRFAPTMCSFLLVALSLSGCDGESADASAKPAASAKAAQTAKPAEDAAPAKDTKPAEDAKPAASAKPAAAGASLAVKPGAIEPKALDPKALEPKALDPKITSLTKADIEAGFEAVELEMTKCGSTHGAKAGEPVTLKVVVEGSGAVSKATPMTPHSGTALGDCVAKVASTAKFAAFKEPTMGFQYSVTM